MKTLALNLLSFICISAFWLSSCGPDKPSCPDNKVNYVNMLEDYKRLLPYYYNALDTLHFISSLGDTQVFYGDGVQTFYTDEYERDPNPDCNRFTLLKREAYKIDFNSSNGTDIHLVHQYRTQGNLEMVIWDKTFRIQDIDIGSDYRAFYASIPKNSPEWEYQLKRGLVLFYDSLTIRGRKYYRVTEFSGTDTTDKILINRQEGVLRGFNSTNSSFWDKLQ